AIIFEVELTRSGDAAPQAQISPSDNPIQALLVRRMADFIQIEVIGGFFDECPPDSVVGIGVDSSGSPIVFVDGIPVDIDGAGDGMFLSGAALIAADIAGQTSGSGSVTFRTAAADFTQTYP